MNKKSVFASIDEFFSNGPTWLQTSGYFIRWFVLAGLIGCVGGVLGGLFARCITMATVYRTSHDWTLFLMPLAGLLIVGLYALCKETNNRGTNAILEALTENQHITFMTGPLIFAATTLTHLVGGSAGREGAALQLGGTVGTHMGRLFHLDKEELRIAVMCGMSSVFGALFGTPVAAAIFCMEVSNVGVFYYATLFPCLLSSLLGSVISGLLGVEAEAFHLSVLPEIEAPVLAHILLLGICCALLSILICVTIHQAEHLYRKYLPNPYVRVLIASAIFITGTLLVGTRTYCGSSMILIEESLAGEVHYEAFILKLLFTAIALGGGFKGGEIVPTLCVGATFGAALGSLMGANVPLMAACGMISTFAGVTNCPLASILIGLELFQGKGLVFFAVAVAISFSLSGYFSLYHSQKFAYSKTRSVSLKDSSGN